MPDQTDNRQPRRTGHKLALGRYGEDLAVRLLEERGYVILQRNWRSSVGEVDIVARDGDCLVFVEVKTRRGHGAGYAEEAMTPRKAARLTELGQLYLAEQGLSDIDWRIDLLAIELGARGETERVNLVRAVTVDQVG
ncbi:MAG: YraN family protein [Chloroflexi bacterium]|nr:YraN family protein [Chloroflexota bacterium]